jgi:hypothetical protein
MPRLHWRAIASSGQFRLALIYFFAGAVLSNYLLTLGAVALDRRVMVAGVVGLAFLVAFTHVMILWLFLKLSRGSRGGASQTGPTSAAPRSLSCSICEKGKQEQRHGDQQPEADRE